VDRVLRLDSLPTAIILALTAVPMTMMGGQLGILQGERRWYPLAVVYIANGLPRLLIGVALIAWRPDELTAIVGCRPRPGGPGARRLVDAAWCPRQPRPTSASTVRARCCVRPSTTPRRCFAFFALSNLDIIVARNVLDDHLAGLYAGGLILTKAVLFLPQFVVVVAFPTMATASERRARSPAA
jgi:O-antigen/teichoic acid export membrane protein